MNASLVSSPGKPEETDSEADSSDDDGWESPFWYGHVVVRCQLAVVRWGYNDHVDASEDFA